MISAVAELWTALIEEWGQSVTYKRNGLPDLPVTALAGTHLLGAVGVNVEEIGFDEFDWLVLVSDLTSGGNQLVPMVGDQITANGVTYEITHRLEAKPYRYASQARQIYRIFTEEI